MASRFKVPGPLDPTAEVPFKVFGLHRYICEFDFNIEPRWNEERKKATTCDIQLIVGPKKEVLKTHRSVLTNLPTMFQAMLNSNMSEANEGVINLPTLKPYVVNIILDFFYTGNLMIRSETFADLMITADYISCDAILDILIDDFLEKEGFMRDGDCVEIYRDSAKLNLERLRKYSFDYIVMNFSSVDRVNLDLIDLPIDLLMPLVADLRTVAGPTPEESEDRLFCLLWGAIRRQLSKEEGEKMLPEVLRSVHLIQMSLDTIFHLEAALAHVKEAKEMVQEAYDDKYKDEENKPGKERQELCIRELPRYGIDVDLKLTLTDLKQYKRVMKDSLEGPVRLVNGIPFNLYIKQVTAIKPRMQLGLYLRCHLKQTMATECRVRCEHMLKSKSKYGMTANVISFHDNSYTFSAADDDHCRAVLPFKK